MNTNMNMNIPEVIATLERVIRLERGIPAKRLAVATAKVALEEAPIGYKKTLARAAVREAEEALEKQTTDIAALSASLPDPDAVKIAWVIRAVAEARVDRDHLQKAVTAAEDSLKAAQEAAKSGAWKWQGRAAKDIPESKDVLAARAAIADAKEKLTALSKRAAPLVEMIEKEMESMEEEAESAAWAARGYTEPKPAHIVRAEEAWEKELEAECEVIHIPKTRDEWRAWAATRPVFVEKAEIDEYTGDGEDWIAGAAAFRRIMNGEPTMATVYAEAEAEVAVPTRRKRMLKNTCSDKSWLARLVAAKKARAVAAIA